MEKNETISSGWLTKNVSHRWYERLYEGSKNLGSCDHFISWAKQNSKEINSVIEVGGGNSIFLSVLFSNIEFVGYDISQQAIDWCNENYINPKHKYICGDFEEYNLKQKFDLVFSLACIDHVHNVDKFLEKCVEASKKFIYILAYRGYFPDLKEHFTIKGSSLLFHNLSVSKIKNTLNNLGAKQVKCFSIPVHRPNYDNPYYLGIFAQVD